MIFSEANLCTTWRTYNELVVANISARVHAVVDFHTRLQDSQEILSLNFLNVRCVDRNLLVCRLMDADCIR